MTITSIIKPSETLYEDYHRPKSEEPSHPISRITTKTILSGASAYLLFGPQIAICTVLVNLILSTLTKDFKNCDWFSKKYAVTVLKYNFFSFNLFSVFWGQWFFFLLELILKAPYCFSASSLLLLASLEIGKKSFFATLFKTTCLRPFIEEIFFRGFLQEKIRDIQTLLFKGQDDSKINKTIRVALQTFVFGALHYHPVQGIFNFLLIPSSFVFGLISGFEKEEQHSLCNSVAFHFSNNVQVAFRILIASRYWPLLP